MATVFGRNCGRRRSGERNGIALKFGGGGDSERVVEHAVTRTVFGFAHWVGWNGEAKAQLARSKRRRHELGHTVAVEGEGRDFGEDGGESKREQGRTWLGLK